MHVRARLALSHTLALAVALGAFSLSLFALYRRALYADLDLKLWGQSEGVDDALEDIIGGKSVEAVTDPESWLTEIWDAGGKLVFSSAPMQEAPLGPINPTCANSRDAFNLTLNGGLRLRVFCQASTSAQATRLIRVARVREHVEDQLRTFGKMELLGLPLVLGLSALLGYLLARRALAPVARLTDAARLVTVSRLGERLPVHNPKDELGQLAIAFNNVFQSLERSFHQMRRFTSDASHELRTPLTAIRAMGEVALRAGQDGQDPYETIGSMLEEAQHLQTLCESLLLLSRADAGQVQVRRERIEVAPLVSNLVDLLLVLAEEKDQQLEVEIPAGLAIDVDVSLLKRALGNLLDNAIKYSPVSTTIRMTAKSEGATVRLSVIDQGPGIPSEHLPHVFERFYRVDSTRGRHGPVPPGVGLGLAIAQWAVQLNGGIIHVVSSLNEGSCFTIELPRPVS